jgi:DNA-directed RNA polymerase sigma subunit (sigma70/sigma32)
MTDKIEASDIAEAVEKLPPKFRITIERKFFYGDSLDAIGKRLKVTRERVRQIEAQAMKKLRFLLAPRPELVSQQIVEQAQTDYETKQLIKRLKATP